MDLTDKIRKSEVEVFSIQQVDKKLKQIRVDLKTKKGDETYSIFIDRKCTEFFPGNKYDAEFRLTGSPDFPGDRVETMDVCTMSYKVYLLKTKKGRIVYFNSD